jgi:3-deoxy-manno-octulosonate cytidylyltransferase (CMP-KDO synthetase)
MTDPKHPSGTDRILEAVEKIECEIIVNIQGDEPFLSPEAVNQLVSAFDQDSSLPMATLCFKSIDREDYLNPNCVKVIRDFSGNGLYFSRSPIPYYREESKAFCFWKHMGIYAYRKDFLKKFSQLPKSDLEDTEKLEQLRVLENGFKIRVIESLHESLGIDTEEDLKKAEKILSQKKEKSF